MDRVIHLLTAARGAGLTVRADGEKLIVRGPRDAADTAKQMLTRKAEVLELLRAEAAPAVCSWGACGQSVSGWEADQERPGSEHRRCKHGHRQRDPYWRPAR